MSKIGIKLADGTFYPVLENEEPQKKQVELTTVHDNQSAIKVNLYKTSSDNITEQDYVDTLLIENLEMQKKGEPSLLLETSLDENGVLSAVVTDLKTGKKSQIAVSLAEKKAVEHPFEDENSTGVALGIAAASSGVIGSAVSASKKKKAKKSRNSEKNMEEFSNKENEKMHLDEYNDMSSIMIDPSQNGDSLDSNSFDDDEVVFDEPEITSEITSETNDTSDNIEDENIFKVGNDMDDMDDFNFPDEKEENVNSTEEFKDEDFPSFDEEESKEQETGSYSPSLYDEDTFDETSKDKKKKVLIPVLICGIIAVIGLVALLVFLFVIKPKNSASSQEVPPYTIETTKPANDEAREDEIIIVETPIVEPVNSVAKSSAKGDVIDYKIKWGDTLWDISKTYYKTPWQYQFLADYNNISNPDFILAGAHLDIPPR